MKYSEMITHPVFQKAINDTLDEFLLEIARKIKSYQYLMANGSIPQATGDQCLQNCIDEIKLRILSEEIRNKL